MTSSQASLGNSFLFASTFFFFLDGKVVIVLALIYFEECDRVDICLKECCLNANVCWFNGF